MSTIRPNIRTDDTDDWGEGWAWGFIIGLAAGVGLSYLCWF
jgi:hypothetical protein